MDEEKRTLIKRVISMAVKIREHPKILGFI